MERPLKMWQFLVGLIGIVLALGSVIYNCGTIMGKNDIRLTIVESKQENTDKKVEDLQIKVNDKMDKIGNDIFDIKILLQNKEDRKK